MKQIAFMIILVFSLTGTGQHVAAQSPPESRYWPPRMAPDWQGPPGPENRLEMLRIWKLTEFLGLDQDQAAQFYPALQAHREAMRGIDSSVVNLHKSIFQQVNQGDVSPQQVVEWRQELLALQQKKVAQEQAFLKSLPQYLTPEQQAKYLVFEWRFQQMLRNAIRERGRWPGSQNPPR